MEKSWIEEQEEILGLFEGKGNTGDALPLLEHSPTNRDLSTYQGRLFTSARFLGASFGLPFFCELADECEKAQLNIDKQAREDYMRVAIEQYQNKLQSARADKIRAML